MKHQFTQIGNEAVIHGPGDLPAPWPTLIPDPQPKPTKYEMQFEIREQYTSASGGDFDILVEGCSLAFSFADEEFAELGIEKTDDNKKICEEYYKKEHCKLPQPTHAGTVYFKFISKTDTANLLDARYTKQKATLTLNPLTITACK